MSNILKAIMNIANKSNFEIKNLFSGRNRINNIGEALETFIKDAFSNSINESDENVKLQKYSDSFSWLGNQNNPPDIIIKEGDAIEVKKTQSANTDIALNSSFPKSKLKSDDKMIVDGCRSCENWIEKDLIYSIGHTSDDSIKSIWMVYGSIYCANNETYEIIKQKISNGINEIPNVELAVTNELGRVNRVDPLGITNLRIRGMWTIQNPRKVFDYIYRSQNKKFELVVLIPLTKYLTFPKFDIESLENLKGKDLSISDVKVKNPNNPANLIDSKLIVFHVDEEIIIEH